MEKKQALVWGAGGAVGVAAIAVAAFALGPEHHGLAALDLNHDGQIVNAEIQQSARQRFAELDRNHDGRLTGDELPRGRHGHGHHGGRDHDGFGEEGPPTATPAVGNGAAAAPGAQPAVSPAFPAPPRYGLAAADTDGDGAVNLREFYARMLARTAHADTNHDGTISAEELAAARAEHHRWHDG